MPFWDRTGWKPIQEFYGGASKQGLKRCIEAVVETPYEELDTLDHLSLREWMRRYTSDDGVFLVWEAISMLEQITTQWWEHSASENLYVRKLHYTLKRTAGYSFWPIGGWVKLWKEMAAAYKALGGELLQPASVHARPRREPRRDRRRALRRRGDRGERGRRQRAGLEPAAPLRRRRAAVGPAASGSSSCARTRTAPAGSATGSPPRSR